MSMSRQCLQIMLNLQGQDSGKWKLHPSAWGFNYWMHLKGRRQPFLVNTLGSGVLGDRTLLGTALKREFRDLEEQRAGQKGPAFPGRNWHPPAPLCASRWAFLRHSLIGSSSEPGAERGRAWPEDSSFTAPSRSDPHHSDTAGGLVLQDSSGDRDTQAEDEL